MLTYLVKVLSGSITIFNARIVKLALTANRVNWNSNLQSFLHRDALLSSQCQRVFQVPILYTWSPVCVMPVQIAKHFIDCHFNFMLEKLVSTSSSFVF